MIALTDRKIVIITPPKTASTALHAALCPPGQFVVGFDREGRELGKHLSFVHNEFRSYKPVAIVRHPLDRLVSLYLDYCRIRAHWGAPGPAFEDWVATLPNVEPGTTGEWFWNWTQARCLRDAPSHTEIVHVENLTAWLPTVGLEKLPRVNTSYRRPWKEYYSHAITLARATKLYAEDLQTYGYR